jgi:putative flippase GtrA
MISNNLLRQLFYFGVVGLTATFTNYLTAVAIHEYYDYSLYTAQFVGYCFAVTISLFGHSKLTFKAQLNLRVFLRFVAVSLSTLWLSELLLLLLESLLELPHRLSLFLVVFTIPVITFFLNKLWVFHERKRVCEV